MREILIGVIAGIVIIFAIVTLAIEAPKGSAFWQPGEPQQRR